MRDRFAHLASRCSDAVGSPWAFLLAFALTLGWLVSGPFFDFSDTWQLIINTATTITTGLIVFLIQNSQNRDTKALHLKLDEILTALSRARNWMVGAELLSEKELDALYQEVIARA